MINEYFLSYLLILALFLILIGGFFTYKSYQKKKRKERNLSFARKPMHKSKILACYEFLENNKLTGRFVRQASRNYEIIYPDDLYSVAKATIRMIVLTYFVSFACIICIFILNKSVISFLTAILLIFVIINELFMMSVHNAESKLLKQLVNFLTLLRQFYNDSHDIEKALWETLNNSKKEMKVHGTILYNALTKEYETREQRSLILQEYNEKLKNKYMKMLLSICADVQENGEQMVKGESLFLNNLSEIKKSVRAEIRRLEKNRFLFTGFSFVAVSPIVGLPYIANWGIYISPEKTMFYLGLGGLLVSALAFVATVFCYNMICNMKDENSRVKRNYKLLTRISNIPIIKSLIDRYLEFDEEKTYRQKKLLKRLSEKYGPRELFLRRLISALFTMIVCIFLLFYGHELNRTYLLNNSDNIGENSMGLNKNEIIKMKDDVLVIVNELKDVKDITLEQVTDYIYSYTSGKLYAIEATAEESYERILTYQNEYISGYEFLGLIIVTIAAYWLPYLLLLDRKNLIQDSMHEEVMQFQMLISLRKDSPSCNTYNLLCELEVYAKIFKKTIQECIVSYNIDDTKALQTMKEQEDYEPFQRLADCFIMTDTESVASAFAELASDRKNDIEDKNQELEIATSRKMTRGYILAFVPSVIILGGYLMFPLIANTLNKMAEFNTLANSAL